MEFRQHDDGRESRGHLVQSKPGDRVRLVSMGDDYTNLRPGYVGTVKLIDRFGTIHVAWDDGTYLGLVPGMDRWEAV